jgi:hypothetical protein
VRTFLKGFNKEVSNIKGLATFCRGFASPEQLTDLDDNASQRCTLLDTCKRWSRDLQFA